MKEFIAKYQKAIVGTGAVALLVISYFQQQDMAKMRREIKEIKSDSAYLGGGDIRKAELIDSLSNLSDSLRNEVFVSGVQLARYEIALELLKEQDKKAADKFELIFTTQTE